MPSIKVDHSKFEAKAKAVEDCISALKNKMKQADSVIETLGSGWEGPDFKEYKDRWDELTKSESVYKKLLGELENYADFLRHAADKYKETQADAINRADRLPRY